MSTAMSTREIHIGDNTIIQHPAEFENPDNISFGNQIRVRMGSWFDCSTPEAKIEIGDGCAIGRDNQISTSSKIVLEKCVLTAANVHISTQTHNYEDIDKPIMSQGTTDNGSITLGEGCWIGRNSLIFASVGKGSVVAANSFVNKDVPDYCVVAGSPAKIIKRYSHEEKRWLRCV